MSDVTVHIDETLNQRSVQALIKEITRQGGIDHIDYNEHKPHLMVVNYDHDKLDSAGVLSAFTDQGLHAELIGF